MASKRSYGWIPDVPDHRDYPYTTYFKVPRKLPPYIDLRPQCSSVEDQGSLGSCTAQALVGAFEFLDPTSRDWSRLFLYYNERVMIGTVPYDSGAYLRDGIKSLNKEGICPEDMWPYKISKFKTKPPQDCYATAIDHQIVNYFRLSNLQEIKACLTDGYPVSFGFTVYESFHDIDSSGIMLMPLPNENVLGGHAVLAVGYDDAKQCLIVRNSWGPDWGDHGYFYMPYAYITPGLSDDYWAIREIEENGSYPPPSLWRRFVNWIKSWWPF